MLQEPRPQVTTTWTQRIVIDSVTTGRPHRRRRRTSIASTVADVITLVASLLTIWHQLTSLL